MLSCPPDLSSLHFELFARAAADEFLMNRGRIRHLARLLALVLFFVPLTTSLGQKSQPSRRARAVNQKAERANEASARPRLVLLIVVDQFRYDYLSRFGDLFGLRGIGRLMRQGASWTNANFDHVPTFTAPGHAVFMTGAWPAQTGIIANDWYERETGKKVKSITDDTTLMLAGKPGEKGKSPRRLLCSTVGDELRSADNDWSKVIGISAKDRSAILPAGRRANAAYWFSNETGNVASSTYYFDKLPDWVTRFNGHHMADGWFGAHWNRLLPESEYLKRAGKDDVPWENLDKSSNDTNFFPHVITGGAPSPNKFFYKALDYTPFSNDLLVSFAEEAIANEKLGDDADPDILSVSFSADDYVGHRFGIYSHEEMDITLRVDQQIGTLLDYIDAHVGLRNTVVLFTADHGASPVPEQAALLGLPGRRYDRADVLQLVQEGLKSRYGRKDRPATDYIQTFTSRGEVEQGFLNSNFYLNREALKRDGIAVDECERAVGEIAMRLPGVARYFTRAQLENKRISDSDPVARRVLHGFYPPRSGDVVIVYDPYTIQFDIPDDPTDPHSTGTHGSPYSYDTHVPLIIMGRAFAKGSYKRAATPADIATTLSKILHIQRPGCALGRVLSEAFVRSNH